jgi:O-acetyl-ADP-ribose deacetylase (regulator of RNase III)
MLTDLIVRGATLRLWCGNIVDVQADAIVNAANSALAGGGGVDGAIHRAGGPSIMAECRRIGRCPTGSAVITAAGALPARYVIHAVAPVYDGGGHGEAALLRGAYTASLTLAAQHALRSIAFPALGTGAYGYPVREAANIALQTIAEHLRGETSISVVTVVLFASGDLAIHAEVLERLAQSSSIAG